MGSSKAQPGAFAALGFSPFAGAACLAALLAPSTAALADSIPFKFDNQESVPVCVKCDGPFFRSSKVGFIASREQKEFYEAEINSFSPFGQWSCSVWVGTYTGMLEPRCPTERAAVNEIATANFCLANIPSVEVDLVLEDGTIDVNFSQTCDSLDSAATSTLGDDLSMSGRDKDSYLFEGAAGDEVTVELRGDGTVGHQGDRAVLLLTQEKGGFRALERGRVPLSLHTVLPADGSYRISLRPAGRRQDDLGSGESGALRGGYEISVRSTGAHGDLIPASDVEE